MTKRKVGVLISGNGSNLQALIDACAKNDFPAEIAVVISNNEQALGLNRAASVGIPAHIINHRDYPSREAFDEAMHHLLERHLCEFVCLAGFMRLLSNAFVERWHNRLINIHPSLLPAFKGAHAHADAIAAGVRISGCSVHFVRAEVDAGPIIAQVAVPVHADDTPETLGARVLEQEHKLYPQALRWLVEGRLTLKSDKVKINGMQSPQGILANPAFF